MKLRLCFRVESMYNNFQLKTNHVEYQKSKTCLESISWNKII
jgi:hypothetical protein